MSDNSTQLKKTVTSNGVKLWDETRLAVDAAKSAGERVMSIYNSDFLSERKKDGSEITEADRLSQEAIKSYLQKSGLPMLSEEQEDDMIRLNQERIWIVDPLDGTADFVDRTGEFSVMIALVQESLPVAGVIYRPTTGALFVAQKGQGSYVNDGGSWKKLEVNKISDLAKIRAVMSRHHLTDKERKILDELCVANFIQMGSAGLKAVAIAQGEADLYLTMTDKIKQWDTAAAHCLVAEAGGRITDLLGRGLVYNTEDVYHRNGILISNGFIHSGVVETCRRLKL